MRAVHAEGPHTCHGNLSGARFTLEVGVPFDRTARYDLSYNRAPTASLARLLRGRVLTVAGQDVVLVGRGSRGYFAHACLWQSTAGGAR